MTLTPSKRLRVLIVDDSAVQRQALTCLLARDPELEIAGWAANGAEALRAIAQLQPDVVTLDEHMPVIDGLETARRIMHEAPTPIVMITGDSELNRRTLHDAASAVGVLAVQSKQALLSNEPSAAAELVRVVKGMAAVRLVRRRREPTLAVTA